MDGSTYTKLCEGCTLVAVKDSRGWEIGYGHNDANVVPGLVWTQEQAEAQFAADYQNATTQAAIDLGAAYWRILDDVRQAALADMAYELGAAGLSAFRQMLAAVRSENWQAAHDQCLASAYARQVPERADRAANMLLTGQWQPGYGA